MLHRVGLALKDVVIGGHQPQSQGHDHCMCLAGPGTLLSQDCHYLRSISYVYWFFSSRSVFCLNTYGHVCDMKLHWEQIQNPFKDHSRCQLSTGINCGTFNDAKPTTIQLLDYTIPLV